MSPKSAATPRAPSLAMAIMTIIFEILNERKRLLRSSARVVNLRLLCRGKASLQKIWQLRLRPNSYQEGLFSSLGVNTKTVRSLLKDPLMARCMLGVMKDITCFGLMHSPLKLYQQMHHQSPHTCRQRREANRLDVDNDGGL